MKSALHSGESCPECIGARCVISEDAQGVKDCPSCERVIALLPEKCLSGAYPPSSLAQMFVDLVTKKIDTISFCRRNYD